MTKYFSDSEDNNLPKSISTVTRLLFNNEHGFLSCLDKACKHGSKRYKPNFLSNFSANKISSWELVVCTVIRLKKKVVEQHQMKENEKSESQTFLPLSDSSSSERTLLHSSLNSQYSASGRSDMLNTPSTNKIQDLNTLDSIGFVSWTEKFYEKTIDNEKDDRFKKWCYLALRDQKLIAWIQALHYTILNSEKIENRLNLRYEVDQAFLGSSLYVRDLCLIVECLQQHNLEVDRLILGDVNDFYIK